MGVLYSVSDRDMRQQNRKKTSVVGQMRLVSLVGLTISLFILGIIGLLRFGTYALKNKINEQFCVTVVVPHTFTTAQQEGVRVFLEKRPEVKAIRYVSREEAAEEIAQGLGQSVSELIEPLGENPFDAVYELRIEERYMRADSLEALDASLRREGLDVGLSYRTELLSTLADNTKLVELVSWGLLLVLGVLTYIQMANTIRMVIYSDRLNIRILTLVGASFWFVRAPIIRRAAWDGGISACFAILALGGLLYIIDSILGIPVFSIMDVKFLLLALAAFVLVAVLSTTFAALMSTQRYIRMRSGLIHLD